VLTQNESQSECFIRIGKDADRSLKAFEALKARKGAIEAVFGEPLDWQELPGKSGCRICKDLEGGWKTPESDWLEMQDRLIDALIRLDAALRKPIQELNV
jgi:hypothetical protein